MNGINLPEKLVLPPHPTSSFMKSLVLFHYNNLIHLFALSSVRNSNKLSFDTLTNLQQYFFSMFYKNKSLVSII